MPTILAGHTSADTAYVVESYPYGFRLRCRKRYWVETNRHGQRLWSQTSNPKVAGDPWNKPKAGIYHDMMILYLDDAGLVHVAAAQATSGPETLNAFLETYGNPSDPATIARWHTIVKVSRRLNRESWARWDEAHAAAPA